MKTKELLAFVIMLAGAALIEYFLPWWVHPAWVIIVVVLMKMRTWPAIIYSGLALALVWVGFARWMSEKDTAEIIHKTGELMGGISHQNMMSITLLIGFITGILSGWFGGKLASVMRSEAV